MTESPAELSARIWRRIQDLQRYSPADSGPAVRFLEIVRYIDATLTGLGYNTVVAAEAFSERFLDRGEGNHQARAYHAVLEEFQTWLDALASRVLAAALAATADPMDPAT
jgi:hypothetical protein